jgi:hypothetical protein
MGWSTHVEIHFVPLLAWEYLVNTSLDTFCFLRGMGWVCSTHVEIHFVTSLYCEGFVLHKLRCILCPLWQVIGFFYTYCGSFHVFTGMELVWSTQIDIHFCPRRHGWGLVNTCCDAFCVLAGMGRVWSTNFEMPFVSSLTWGGFDQHRFRCILRPRWHGMGLDNTC